MIDTVSRTDEVSRGIGIEARREDVGQRQFFRLCAHGTNEPSLRNNADVMKLGLGSPDVVPVVILGVRRLAKDFLLQCTSLQGAA